MATTINTNVVSINAQRNLGLSGNSLGTSMQRLSSGLRVNSAKDDAAGLAIAERMNSQVRGFAVASRNANDGISLAQTAEGALGKVGDMLQRMRELAAQASNATNSRSDRDALQAELHQLREEIDRVAKTTSFNGQKVLDGSFTGAVFQVGPNSGDNITVGALSNTAVHQLGVSAYLVDEEEDGFEVDEDAKDEIATLLASEDEGDRTITITGANEEEFSVVLERDLSATGNEALGKVVAAINSKTADTGVTAFLETNEDGETVIKARALALPTDSPNSEDGIESEATIEGFGIEITMTGHEEQEDGFYTGLTDISISTQVGAWEAIQRIDSAIDKVNAARADLGAIQTRFEKTIENLDSMHENISAARGRIVDADFAKETANLSR
ncbi:MAG: flagellin, partial [Comamonas sp.]|nr:flagellin [Comamonas sp.]